MLFRSVQQHQLEIPDQISREWLTTKNRWYADDNWSVLASVSAKLLKSYCENTQADSNLETVELRGTLIGFDVAPDQTKVLHPVMVLGSAAFYSPNGEILPANSAGTVIVDLQSHLQHSPVLYPPFTIGDDGYEQQLVR